MCIWCNYLKNVPFLLCLGFVWWDQYCVLNPVTWVLSYTPNSHLLFCISFCFKVFWYRSCGFMHMYLCMSSSELFLFSGMLEYDPVKRFSIQRIRQHKWVHQCMWSAWFLTDRMQCYPSLSEYREQQWRSMWADNNICSSTKNYDTIYSDLLHLEIVKGSQQAPVQWESFQILFKACR